MKNVTSNGWWNSLKHGGMLIAPSKLSNYFSETIAPVPNSTAIKLRKVLTQFSEKKKDLEAELLQTVLVNVCGFNLEWKKATDIGREYSVKAITGETIRPRWILDNGDYTVLPVFMDASIKRIGVGKGRRTHARTVEWLRGKGEKLALLTNMNQWRLIYAGLDFDAWVEWDTDLWFQEGKPSEQLDALRILINPAAFKKSSPGGQSSIIEAIQESRKGQAELSSELGERVRSAVELLIQDHSKGLSNLPQGVGSKEIYLAATRMVMRMVVALFAEARDLLPRDNVIYHTSYGLQGLLGILEKTGSGKAIERLKYRNGAWPRIVSLCRLIFAGSGHQALPVPRYGGDLFRPGDLNSDDATLRAITIFENPEYAANDATVLKILNLLCRSRVKVRQGHGSVWIDAPVDFSDLSSEYIGILYEGLLDYELKKAAASDAVIFLGLGNQPALNLSVLEEMDDKALKDLVENMKVTKETGDDESTEEPEVDAVEEPIESEDEIDPEDPIDEQDDATTDHRHEVRSRALTWARKAVIAGKLVKLQRGKKGDLQKSNDDAINKAAATLIKRVIMPEEWYLVRWGGTRKGSGTFYTRPQLAVPTVHRTLRPLAFTAPLGKDNEPNEMAPPQEWTPKLPEEILGLKVCDPAMGSGSFPVAALRFLTDSLLQSLYHHGRIHADGERTLVTLAEGKESVGSLREEYLPCRPDADDFEPRLKARLKRYIVEECIYGVDLDPLAVELARLSLWIETMDRNLPFEFLDHKLKAGNSLVGCWLSRFRDYPVMAWMRDGGDGDKGPRTQKINEMRKGQITSELKDIVTGQYSAFDTEELSNPLSVHKEALDALNAMRLIPVHQMEERAAYYRTHIVHNEHILNLKKAFDIYCAIWFWPVNKIENAPGPKDFLKLNSEKENVLNSVTKYYRFFHWELEFPDVFNNQNGGFNAIIGNPPWETLQPQSLEFFSNIDPLYRTYGNQEAKRIQQVLFNTTEELETSFFEYVASFKCYANWMKYSGSPYGNSNTNDLKFAFERGKENKLFHDMWEKIRSKNKLNFPFGESIYSYQGSGKPYTYRLFSELSYHLLKETGIIGIIIPSGIYSDKGSEEIRKLFLNKCNWKWIFGFENRKKIFDIDGRFKFCPIIVKKGGATKEIKTAFMRHNLEDWENAQNFCTLYSNDQINKFSPLSFTILEIQNKRDIAILNTIYSNSILLGDKSVNGWNIVYAQGDFNMTSDSKLFPPRPQWEEKGYRPDEYGRWIGPDGDMALPLYEGRMVGQFDFSEKGWVSGKGRTAVWREIPWERKVIEPQFLVSESHFQPERMWKCGQLRISSATNTRTAISAFLARMPCGDTVATLRPKSISDTLILTVVLNSFVFDSVTRKRVAGLHVDQHLLNALPLPNYKYLNRQPILKFCLGLSIPSWVFAPEWLLLSNLPCLAWLKNKSIQNEWAISGHERIRRRCILDSLLAIIYGLSYDDQCQILSETDYPQYNPSLDINPKGFWRVDKEKSPELRHTVLSLVAFHDLQKLIDGHNGDREKGIEAFCNQNSGEGWMLPETLRLADYGLGHDDRAKEYQPVAEKFGPRFYDWQLEQTPEESWAECERHARNILGEKGFERLQRELSGEIVEEMAVSEERAVYNAGKEGIKDAEQLSFL